MGEATPTARSQFEVKCCSALLSSGRPSTLTNTIEDLILWSEPFAVLAFIEVGDGGEEFGGEGNGPFLVPFAYHPDACVECQSAQNGC